MSFICMICLAYVWILWNKMMAVKIESHEKKGHIQLFELVADHSPNRNGGRQTHEHARCVSGAARSIDAIETTISCNLRNLFFRIIKTAQY